MFWIMVTTFRMGLADKLTVEVAITASVDTAHDVMIARLRRMDDIVSAGGPATQA